MKRILLSALVCASITAHAQDWEAVEIQSEQLAEGVYMLTGRGGNLGLAVGPDGAFLIDDQYAPLTDRITAAIASITDQPVRFVLNTHWHGDHTGGNENLGNAGVLIVAHDNVRERMSTEQFMAFFDSKVPASPAAALPVVTFNDQAGFHLNGEHLRAIHVPLGHTDGDSMVWMERANVLHMGDLFFNGMYPFIDVDSGGSINGMIAGAAQALRMVNDETRIIPGHGPATDKAGLQAYHDMLVAVRDQVAGLKKAGKTLEEAIAAKPGGDYDAELGGGFIKPDAFITFVYRSLP